ncbi:MAG TPA: AraC family transcriptional regulator [Flavitalea sp.]|nr:AraC family transcriptional regulator [Flavitalea sp.]
MINLYQALKSYPGFSRQLVCKGILFTNYDCPQTSDKEKFYIECSYIAYVISGVRIFHKNSKSWELKEGSCVFVKKGAHISEKPPQKGWCVMVFFVPDKFLKQLIDENRNSFSLINLPAADEDMVLPLDVNELSKAFFFSMLPYFTQTPPPPENLLELKFKELVLSLLSNKKNNHFLSYLSNLYNEINPSLAEVMQNNFAFNLTLEEYAKLACKSVPTFKREFKKNFNDSPAKWVLRKKLTLATELLENTSLSVSEICYECGFENQTHFSRVFKEKIGASPLQFRTNLQNVG